MDFAWLLNCVVRARLSLHKWITLFSSGSLSPQAATYTFCLFFFFFFKLFSVASGACCSISIVHYRTLPVQTHSIEKKKKSKEEIESPSTFTAFVRHSRRRWRSTQPTRPGCLSLSLACCDKKKTVRGFVLFVAASFFFFLSLP